MPTSRSKPGQALGLTSAKARSSIARASGKRAAKIDQAAKAVQAAVEVPPKTAEPPARTYPPALLKQAEGRPTLDTESAKYDALWEHAKKTMGMEPIHAASTNRIEHILRVFDMDPTYGPCMGMTRLERWQRAKDIGEDPPDELREILLTREGILDFQYSVLDQSASIAVA
ncbi:dna polymerase delta subunit 4 [Malassezia pachydermatis]|uniref:Dna polymerase delta subunit 4 n=1 Tax=Malassezia pachydermatis TaxID=77020 RepID=A0A0M8MX56_9BASI|nr:dna polymerase delta subunit 4 [Malassezia pachydermatis]KOS15600.1 dna polymerase delta subunit 4 [Malassezia pachydermatis]